MTPFSSLSSAGAQFTKILSNTMALCEMDKEMEDKLLNQEFDNISYEEYENAICSKCGGNLKLTSQQEIKEVIQQMLNESTNKDKQARIFTVEL